MLRVSLLLLCTAIAACRPRDPKPVPPADASPPPKLLADTLVLAGPYELDRAAFTPTGDVVVTTPHALLRLAAVDGAPAEIVPLPERGMYTATARAADITVIQGESGAIYVARGRDVTRIGKAAPFGALSISDDGRVFTADNEDDQSPPVGVFDLTGRRLARVDRPTFLAPNGDWASSPGHVVPVLAPGPAIDVDHGDPLGWSGTTAIFTDERGVVLVDTAAHAKTAIPTCRNARRSSFDSVAKRVIVVCTKAIVVVDLDARKSSTIPLPAVAQDPRVDVDVSPAATGIGLYANVFRPEPIDRWQLSIDPIARTTKMIAEGAVADRRSFDGRPEGWTNGAPSADDTRWARIDSGMLQIADPTGHFLATWGLSLERPARIHVNGDGLDGDGTHRIRIGPDAPELHREPVPDDRASHGSCPTELHVPVATGELWLERKTTSRPNACICSGGTCKDTPRAPFLTALTGRDDALILATWGPSSPDQMHQVHVTGLDGTVRGMISVPAACHEAIPRPDKPIAAVLCGDVVIELDLVTGKELRRTPVHDAFAKELFTVTEHDVVVQSFEASHQRNYLRVLEAGTGHVRAEVYIWANTAIVRFDEGAIEVFGEAAVSERALRCVTDGVARPWDTCREQRLVHDRFRLQ